MSRKQECYRHTIRREREGGTAKWPAREILEREWELALAGSDDRGHGIEAIVLSRSFGGV